MKQEKGITLIALVITIIVLLILAGVAIAMVAGDGGVPKKAQQAAQETSFSDAKSNIATAAAAALADYYDYTYSEGRTLTSTQKTAIQTAGNVQAYVLSVIDQTPNKYATGITAVVSTTNNTVTLNHKDTGVAAQIGDVDDNGSLTWRANS